MATQTYIAVVSETPSPDGSTYYDFSIPVTSTLVGGGSATVLQYIGSYSLDTLNANLADAQARLAALPS